MNIFLILFYTDMNYWLPASNVPAYINSFKVSNRNTRKRCELCSELTKKTQERRQQRRSGVFIVIF